MRVNEEHILIGAIVLIFIWLAAISFAIVDLYAYKEFILEHLNDIYDMIADVYNHLTNLLEMGVLI